MRDGQHEVGRGGPFRQFAVEFKAYDFRDQHGDGLAQHRCFSFNPANAPAQNGQAIDHGGVAVGPHDAVRVGDFIAAIFGGPNGLGQIFEVHLVADARAGGHNAEVLKRALAPTQEFIALAIAVIFKVNVLGEAVALTGIIHHH